MSNFFNDLALTSVGNAMSSAIGSAMNFLQSTLANGGRDINCKFYHSNGIGGSLLQVATKKIAQGVVSELKSQAVNGFNSLLNGKKKESINGTAWVSAELEKQKEEATAYGKMVVKDTSNNECAVLALDDWGCVAAEALMLGIEVKEEVKVSQSYYKYSSVYDEEKKIYKEQDPKDVNNSFTTHSLVWYDTTALITINSDKNLVTTRVTGRDYSRKELVSNGDIKFSVSGQITSGKPDIYPTEEMKKFYKVMQYKGIVKINNIVLDQLGISNIVIENFNVSPKQGYKGLQQYTFSAIGLQPDNDIIIEKDTVNIIAQKRVTTGDNEDSEWLQLLKNQLEGLKSMASDVVSQGLAIGTGYVDNLLDKI